MGSRVNFAIVRALAKRDLRLYFSSPSGYVFITLFIFLSAAAAFWQDRFFFDNLANLEQLNRVFPLLLLLFIPTLTMSVWAEEWRLGTAELLFTLPATDLEIVLGKYAATLGIYSASLVLSLSHVFVLVFLGSPDVGLMFGNYIGYWLVGAALIPAGMLASLLTINMTVAFILGALFCGGIIFLDLFVGVFSVDAGLLAASLSVVASFGDFAKGVLSLSGFLLFTSVAGFFVYLNRLVVSCRHWPSRADGFPMWSHHAVRAVALAVALAEARAVDAMTGGEALDPVADAGRWPGAIPARRRPPTTARRSAAWAPCSWRLWTSPTRNEPRGSHRRSARPWHRRLHRVARSRCTGRPGGRAELGRAAVAQPDRRDPPERATASRREGATRTANPRSAGPGRLLDPRAPRPGGPPAPAHLGGPAALGV